METFWEGSIRTVKETAEGAEDIRKAQRTSSRLFSDLEALSARIPAFIFQLNLEAAEGDRSHLSTRAVFIVCFHCCDYFLLPFSIFASEVVCRFEPSSFLSLFLLVPSSSWEASWYSLPVFHDYDTLTSDRCLSCAHILVQKKWKKKSPDGIHSNTVVGRTMILTITSTGILFLSARHQRLPFLIYPHSYFHLLSSTSGCVPDYAFTRSLRVPSKVPAMVSYPKPKPKPKPKPTSPVLCFCSPTCNSVYPHPQPAFIHHAVFFRPCLPPCSPHPPW